MYQFFTYKRGGEMAMGKSLSSRMLGLVFSCMLLAPYPAISATEEETQETQETSSGRPDFLFGAPKFSFGVRGGLNAPSADSDIYEFVTDELTIERGDFRAPLISFDLAYRINEHLAAVVGFEYSRAEIQSESRDYVDMDDMPILQETKLSQLPLTGSLKFYLFPKGREISQYAWVPNSFLPFVGGGGGFVWYRFAQVGDFVDYTDLSIFFEQFNSEGWAPTAHVFGGVDIKLIPRVFFTFEMRYSWADAELSGSFVDFDPIDLAGLRASFGVDLLF
jgi:hypothetical protein